MIKSTKLEINKKLNGKHSTIGITSQVLEVPYSQLTGLDSTTELLTRREKMSFQVVYLFIQKLKIQKKKNPNKKSQGRSTALPGSKNCA